jgi:polar amino acid transport system substrate-binding protein
VQAGKIRVALFLPQFTRDPRSDELQGRGTGAAAIELMRMLAARLGIETEMVGYPTPASVVDCLKTGACDVAFMGIEPSRTAELDFSLAIFAFDYTFLVPAGSAIDRAAALDRPGCRIGVVRNHASTLALSRIVRHAALVGADLPDAVFEMLRAGQADAVAFPRDVLIDFSLRLPGSRVLEDAYGVNRVGIAMRKGRPGRLAAISEFVEEARETGLIQRAIDSSRVHGFRVAPRDERG